MTGTSVHIFRQSPQKWAHFAAANDLSGAFCRICADPQNVADFSSFDVNYG